MNINVEKSAKTIYNKTVDKLSPYYQVDEARQLARILMEDFLNIRFEQVLMDEQLSLTSVQEDEFSAKVNLLKRYYPVQYILESAHFYGRTFFVNDSVLIPRQETEELINEIVIDNKRSNLKILDIGSGSGCIGITLGLELENAQISALDVDPRALEVTQKNASKLGINIDCILCDVLSTDMLPDMYDVIVSNPPYVTMAEKKLMHENVVDHEPHKALFVPDDDPLIFYKKILSLARNHLRENGKLYFEINEKFGPDLIELCEKERFASLRLLQDMNGKNRFIKARMN